MYPTIPADAWPDTYAPHAKWTTIAANNYALSDEITVLVQRGTGGGCLTDYPENGRMMHCDPSMLGDHPTGNGGEGTLSLLTHELGHYFGLQHTWESPHGLNPASQQRWSWVDQWDMAYVPGSGLANVFPTNHVFFNSRADASQFTAANPSLVLRPIWDRDKVDQVWTPTGQGANCARNGAGVTCTLIGEDASGNPNKGYVETYNPGDAQIKGMDIPTLGPAQTYAVNAMSYYVDGTPTKTFSDSQIEVMKQYLQSEATVTSQLVSTDFPAGSSGTLHSYRSRLGALSQYAPARNIDFDHDGLRDIAFWRPPASASVSDLGHFSVLLSSKGWVGPGLEVDFGGLGDTPVLADYDGDGVTDFAVFQHGGGPLRDDPNDVNGYWMWCKSSSFTSLDQPDCSVPGATATRRFGLRQSVPLPGLDFDGNPGTAELAVYQNVASTGRGHFYWLGVNSPGPYQDVQLGSYSALPLPGLYDADGITDLVVYNRHSAAFEMKLSSNSYSHDIVRSFDRKFIGQEGSDLDRSAAVPLEGVFSNALGVARESLSLWFPFDGTWTTQWNPIAGSAINSCQFGHTLDVPIPGLDINGDGLSDRAVFRAPGFGAAGKFYYKAVTASGDFCGGVQTGVSDPVTSGIRNLPAAVSDMTGDGLPDVMVVIPGDNSVVWYTSESGFKVRRERTFGDARGAVL